MNKGDDLVYSMVINRWHKNVALLFDEDSRLNSSKDTVNYIKGFIGSYPNAYVEVNQDELNEFFNLIKNYKDTPLNKKAIFKYVVNRANPNFWNTSDWFNDEFKKRDTINYGLMDLNRYISEASN
jgi:hypothetical protein